MRRLCQAVFACLLSFNGSQLCASPLFESDDVLAMTINGPFHELDDAAELPFMLSSKGETLNVKVRTRGKSRLRVCKFPPLRLNFAKRQTKGGTFSGQNKLKLVTHCKDTAASEQDLLMEYAAYRMFNVIGDSSYRVRMARVTYSDSSGEILSKRPAFFVESGKELRRRLGFASASRSHVTLAELDEAQAALVFVFQFMIGNTDWSLVTADDDKCCHNSELFERRGKLVVVPYDFDLSGLVNTGYARPDPSLEIARVTIRRYRGYCVSPDAVRRALRAVMAKKEAVLDVLNNVPGLDQKTVNTGTKYLNRFFEQGSKDRRLLARFERACL